MTDDRTAPEPDDAQAGHPGPEPTAPLPTAPLSAAQPTAPLPATEPAPPLPAPPQAWPSPTPDAAQPAWGSPAGPVGEPGAPEWARPSDAGAPPPSAVPAAPPYGAAPPPYGAPYGAPPASPVFGAPSAGPASPPAYGTPPAYPYGGAPAGYPYAGAQPAYGTPPGRRGGVSAGLVAAVVVAAVVAVGGLVAGLFAVSAGGDDDASGPVVPAPSFDPPSPDASGDPAPGLTSRTTPAPAPRVPSPTTGAGTAYVKQANAFCRSTTDPDLKALEPLQQTDPAKYLRSAAKVNRQLDDRLRKDVPKELSGTVGEITKSWDALSEYYEKAADAFEAGDAAAFEQNLSTAQDANERGNDLAKQIGMNDCADAGGLGRPDGGTPTTPGQTV